MESSGIEIKESARAKHARIEVHPDGRVIATKPARMSMLVFRAWVATRARWIKDAQAAFERKAARRKRQGREPIALSKPRKGSKAYQDARNRARALARERLAHFNETYGFTYGSIAIRDQKTRWGSCSAANNLSFSYTIALLPPRLADYVIVHELCHAREHNHSPRFWELVARTFPDYDALRKELGRYKA